MTTFCRLPLLGPALAWQDNGCRSGDMPGGCSHLGTVWCHQLGKPLLVPCGTTILVLSGGLFGTTKLGTNWGHIRPSIGTGSPQKSCPPIWCVKTEARRSPVSARTTNQPPAHVHTAEADLLSWALLSESWSRTTSGPSPVSSPRAPRRSPPWATTTSTVLQKRFASTSEREASTCPACPPGNICVD